MIVRTSKLPCRIFDLNRCEVEGYPPSCEVLDSSPRNPCPVWFCDERRSSEGQNLHETLANIETKALTVRTQFEDLVKVTIILSNFM